jgi:quinoprotein glucose dehydrogenase
MKKQLQKRQIFSWPVLSLSAAILTGCGQGSQTENAPASVGRQTDVDRSPIVSEETVEWKYLGSDAAHTRYSPADQITPENFGQLEVAWEWDGVSFGARSGRSTPSYMDGMLYTVAGDRRHVVAINPDNGDTRWSYREPNTPRHEYSMRKDYGKGVGYAHIDGRGVVYIISPAFFLTALEAETGLPLEGFGKPVPIKGFPKTGVVDLLADLGHDYDPYQGIPLEKGYLTSSAPPIVVNGVVVVGNSAEQGYNQSRIENIPGDILAYDAKTGEHKWKFNVIPRPGEFGHDTWENDAWKWTGDVSSWAPLSADPERDLVYIPTNGPTIDFYGGFHPGDNLYGTSLLALNVHSGERAWHYQLVHHDIWNYDTPTAPVLLDVTINGQATPIVAQATKQGWVYAFNRETGEPLWPIEEKPVPASKIPGEKLAATQPFPTKPAAFEMQGLSVDDLIDYTPELREKAMVAISEYEYGPIFQPPLHRDNEEGLKGSLWCPGDGGGANINGPAVADPEAGILYVTSSKACTSRLIVPGIERDLTLKDPTGVTPSDWAALRSQGPGRIEGLPIFKPPYSTITAIDMNTGEHIWQIPVGETPDAIKNHPKLQGIDVGNTGTGSKAPMLVTKNMLIYAGDTSDGTPHLFALDKHTGQELARTPVPASSAYGMMTYVHKGHQYLMLQAGAKLVAMGLPGSKVEASDDH